MCNLQWLLLFLAFWSFVEVGSRHSWTPKINWQFSCGRTPQNRGSWALARIYKTMNKFLKFNFMLKIILMIIITILPTSCTFLVKKVNLCWASGGGHRKERRKATVVGHCFVGWWIFNVLYRREEYNWTMCLREEFHLNSGQLWDQRRLQTSL